MKNSCWAPELVVWRKWRLVLLRDYRGPRRPFLQRRRLWPAGPWDLRLWLDLHGRVLTLHYQGVVCV